MTIPMVTLKSDAKGYVIIGATGSGKSFFSDKVQLAMRERGACVLYVPQYPLFRPTLSVEHFIDFLDCAGNYKEEMKTRMLQLKIPLNSRIGGRLFGMLDLPGLSGGQRKKFQLVLVSVLSKVNNADVIVLDEPFAGCDRPSMPEVIEILQSGNENAVSFIVSHDHIDLLQAANFTTLHVDARRITNTNLGLDLTTDEAVPAFVEMLRQGKVSKASASDNLAVDFMFMKLFFAEADYWAPLITYVTFTVFLGIATHDFTGKQIDISETMIFYRMYVYEYAHFSSVTFYCWKEGLHTDDYNIGISKKRYCVFEKYLLQAIVNVPLIGLVEGVLNTFASTYWNIDFAGVIVSYAVCVLMGTAYHTVCTIYSNPINANMSNFPLIAISYACSGIILPTDFTLAEAKWLNYLSGMFHFGCLTDHATSRISLDQTPCAPFLIHMFFLSPMFLVVLMRYINVTVT